MKGGILQLGDQKARNRAADTARRQCCRHADDLGQLPVGHEHARDDRAEGHQRADTRSMPPEMITSVAAIASTPFTEAAWRMLMMLAVCMKFGDATREPDHQKDQPGERQ